MIIYTIGYTKKSAEEFFEMLRNNKIEILIDIRLNNKSQLAGFTKSGDIQYFLRLCGIEYIHCEEFAPSKELLKSYQDGGTSWDEYEKEFDVIMDKRGCCEKFVSKFKNYERVCLLCSEPTALKCHRRLVAERIKKSNPTTIQVIHI